MFVLRDAILLNLDFQKRPNCYNKILPGHTPNGSLMSKIWSKSCVELFHSFLLSNEEWGYQKYSRSNKKYLDLLNKDSTLTRCIFKVSLWICWSTLKDRNGGSDFLGIWNCGIKGCLNIKKRYLETKFGVGMTFHWVIWLKTRAGQKVTTTPMWQCHSRACVD